MSESVPSRRRPLWLKLLAVLAWPITLPIRGLIFLSRKVPGGLMIVPLLFGALLNTVDQMHLPPVQWALEQIAAKPTVQTTPVDPSDEAGRQRLLSLREEAGELAGGAPGPGEVEAGESVELVVQRDGPREFLRIGGFAEAMVNGPGAICLIGLFLFCAGSQMNFRIAGRAIKKGVIITASKYATGVAVGYLLGELFGHYDGLLGLSTMAIIAGMTNSNGGMYAALTAEYGNRSDVGAIAILSLNDGPFLTLVALGILGETFPTAVFLAVLMPILLGVIIGNLDEKARAFLKPGERLTIPFFAFALGTTINFGAFFRPDVLAGGVLLGVMTVLLSATVGILALKFFREKSQVAAVAEASTAGNAAATPAAIAVAASAAVKAGQMTQARADQFQDLVSRATAQISISTILTAVLCPLAVILWFRFQSSRGVDARTTGLEGDPE